MNVTIYGQWVYVNFTKPLFIILWDDEIIIVCIESSLATCMTQGVRFKGGLVPRHPTLHVHQGIISICNT